MSRPPRLVCTDRGQHRPRLVNVGPPGFPGRKDRDYWELSCPKCPREVRISVERWDRIQALGLRAVDISALPF